MLYDCKIVTTYLHLGENPIDLVQYSHEEIGIL